MRTSASRTLAVLLLVILAGSCATQPQTDQPESPQDSIRKGVIAFHNGLYLPTMTALGARYDAGDPWVVRNEPRIQSLSEQYVLLKDEIDLGLRTWDAVGSPGTVNEKVQKLLALIGELQTIQRGR